jgi:hypothetical protein
MDRHVVPESVERINEYCDEGSTINKPCGDVTANWGE